MMLRRALAYAKKTFGFFEKIDQYVVTKNYQPGAGAQKVFGMALMMGMSRMGSLNALEQTVKKTLEEIFRIQVAFSRHLCQDISSFGT